MVRISGREVGPGQPCLIIAEGGVNHNGDAALARRLVDAAATSGADAVKFQTFNAERLATASAPKARYQLHTTGSSESQLDMLRRLELARDAYPGLMDRCRRQGLLFLSTPFDEESADFLHELGMACFKIPSGELTNLGLLAHVAGFGKPMIISTGMATLDEVSLAVDTARGAGSSEVILLHCVSSYPAPPREVNLRAMQTLASTFGVPVGFSDHTQGIEAALAAAALGACVIEKHLTLDRSLPGPDHRASLLPEELAAMVQGIRTVEAVLGDGAKKPAASEHDTARVVRKSLVAARDIPKGSTLTDDLVVVKRPGTGLPPGMLRQVIGRTATQDIPGDTVLTQEMLG